MNRILCGLPMCGKTSVGRILADYLAWTFIDVDERIEASFKSMKGQSYSCSQIVRQEGEAYFRQLENQQIALLSNEEQSIIAVGGGSLCNPENRTHLQKIGHLIYLQADAQLLWKRVAFCGIPAYLDQDHPENAFYELMEKRKLILEAAANTIVETNQLSAQEVAEKIYCNQDLFSGQ